jgi:hypothetical protein
MNKFIKKQRGTVLIFSFGIVFVFLLVAPFAIDIGYYFVVKSRLQNIADAAALNGVDVIYNSQNPANSSHLTGLNTFPSGYISYVNTAVQNSFNSNNFPLSYPNISSTSVVVDWWDTGTNIVPTGTPAGHFHYPAVRVSMTYQASVFFAKLLDVPYFEVNVTATAVSEIPGTIAPHVPFVITYCAIYNGWNPETGLPISGGVADFIIGAVDGGGTLYDCIANNITGTMDAGSKKLTVTGGDFKKLSVNTVLNGANLHSDNPIEGVGTPTGTGICTNTPCDYYLKFPASGIITTANIITANSGPLGNWTPLIYSSSNIGAFTIESYIPSATSVTGPGVSIGEEIRVQTGAVDSLYQAMIACHSSGLCNKVAIPVVNGLQCAGGAISCPATTTTNPNFPLTGVNIAPLGIPLNNNFPAIGFACVVVTSVSHGSTKEIHLSLTTGCNISGKGGGRIYYGVLLPPVLAN